MFSKDMKRISILMDDLDDNLRQRNPLNPQLNNNDLWTT
jgi:hypothetical protein